MEAEESDEEDESEEDQWEESDEEDESEEDQWEESEDALEEELVEKSADESESADVVDDDADDNDDWSPGVPPREQYYIDARKRVNCSICLSDIEEGDLERTLHCAHKFHAHCAIQWAEQRLYGGNFDVPYHSVRYQRKFLGREGTAANRHFRNSLLFDHASYCDGLARRRVSTSLTTCCCFGHYIVFFLKQAGTLCRPSSCLARNVYCIFDVAIFVHNVIDLRWYMNQGARR
ncbi:hypothetical protein JKP88DRAFT_246104 [Tribonema minus]|uniref:RING-type domain-containing protein n=1 Tax=Tribonema minus TaxID=303371 RepID=A0A836CDI5_9STRA|nr:hypothetical protein JKP88DRAFT_246104 [Tribonema minus]